ncbi:hypothetical protein [Acidiferrobacter sp.]|uniref:AcrVA2 family anti-CRISPR protein n=1 Tax=Acidiferrobacter sp. TaxID=1872107 RepID=UPI002617438E|nr:hypothetical protein [Acidiferrobacter sp.]
MSEVLLAVDRVRAMRGRTHQYAPAECARAGLLDWPDWCYAPQFVWESGASEVIGQPLNLNYDDAMLLAGMMTLGTWRITKGIYRFDTTTYSEIHDTPISGDIPCEILYRLPEWCVYVETPSGAYCDPLHGHEAIYGFFALLDYGMKPQETYLILALHTGKGIMPFILPLGPWTLADAVRKTWITAMNTIPGHPCQQSDTDADGIARALEPLLSLLVYLCSEAAEIGSGAHRPANPQPKRTKRGPRIFPADKPTTWDVGVRMGAALRREYRNEDSQPQGGSHASPRGHIRRAHWHSYWTGPRTSDARTLIVRWIPPIPVNLNDHDDLPAVVRAVGNADDKA